MLGQSVKVDSQLTKIRTTLVAIKPAAGTKVNFDLQAEVKSVSRNGPKLKLRFTIGIDTFPMIYRAEIEGTAFATAEMLAKDENLEDLGEGVLGDVALQIYRQNFEHLYLALASQGLDAPSPWLVKDVHLVR